MAIEFTNDNERQSAAARRVLNNIVPVIRNAGYDVLSCGPVHGGGYFSVKPIPPKMTIPADWLRMFGAAVAGAIQVQSDHIIVRFEVLR